MEIKGPNSGYVILYLEYCNWRRDRNRLNHPELLQYGKPLIISTRPQNNCENCGKFVHKKSLSTKCTVCLFGMSHEEAVKEGFIQKWNVWKLKMHCLICDCVVKYANTATRLRRICGRCLRSILQLINQCPLYTKDFANLNKSNINKNNAKKWYWQSRWCGGYCSINCNYSLSVIPWRRDTMNKTLAVILYEKKLLLTELKRRLEILS